MELLLAVMLTTGKMHSCCCWPRCHVKVAQCSYAVQAGCQMLTGQKKGGKCIPHLYSLLCVSLTSSSAVCNGILCGNTSEVFCIRSAATIFPITLTSKAASVDVHCVEKAMELNNHFLECKQMQTTQGRCKSLQSVSGRSLGRIFKHPS